MAGDNCSFSGFAPSCRMRTDAVRQLLRERGMSSKQFSIQNGRWPGWLDGLMEVNESHGGIFVVTCEVLSDLLGCRFEDIAYPEQFYLRSIGASPPWVKPYRPHAAISLPKYEYEVRTMYDAGFTIKQIGEVFGCSISVMRKYLNSLGLKRRQ